MRKLQGHPLPGTDRTERTAQNPLRLCRRADWCSERSSLRTGALCYRCRTRCRPAVGDVKWTLLEDDGCLMAFGCSCCSIRLHPKASYPRMNNCNVCNRVFRFPDEGKRHYESVRAAGGGSRTEKALERPSHWRAEDSSGRPPDMLAFAT